MILKHNRGTTSIEKTKKKTRQRPGDIYGTHRANPSAKSNSEMDVRMRGMNKYLKKM